MAKDEEFSDSEDEGDDRRDVRSHKKKEGGVPTPPKRPKVTSEQGDEAAGEKTPSDAADAASSTAAGGKLCCASDLNLSIKTYVFWFLGLPNLIFWICPDGVWDYELKNLQFLEQATTS